MCPLVVLLSLLSAPESGAPPCGVLTMYVGLQALGAAGKKNSLDELWTDMGRGTQKHSLADLARLAESRGFFASGVQTTLDHLTRRRERFVCIAQVSQSHFVIIEDVSPHDGTVRVIDPPRVSETPYPVFAPTWQGHALLISKMPMLSEAEVARLPRVLGDDGRPYDGWNTRWLWWAGGIVSCGLASVWALWRRHS